jgi:hypothetical protein
MGRVKFSWLGKYITQTSLALSCFALPAFSESLFMTWDVPDTPNVEYHIYRRTSVGSYRPVEVISGNIWVWLVPSIGTFYFRVTARLIGCLGPSDDLCESPPSNELKVVVTRHVEATPI